VKILELKLIAYGIHRDRSLNFCGPDGEASGLQIIYGANEAGKSTARRALERFFFGIGNQDPDARMQKATLEVGARLRDSAGQEYDLRRRKKRKDPLVSGVNDEAVDEALMRRLLGGIDEALFHRLFGLDHESLRAGGEALLTGAGRLDRALVGAARLGEILDEIVAEADTLHTPRGSTRVINKLKSQLEKARKETESESLDPRRWDDLEASIAKANEQRDQAVVELARINTELARGERLQRALPKLRELREIDAQLADEAAGNELGADWLAEHDQRQEKLESLRAKARELAEARSRLQGELEDLSDHGSILDQSTDIKLLFRESDQHAENAAALAEDEWALPAETAEDAALLADLDHLDGALAQARELLNDELSFGSKEQERQAKKSRHELELKQVEAKLTELPESLAGHRLSALAERLRAFAQRETEARGQRAQLQRNEETMRRRADALSAWSGSLDEIAEAAWPSPAALREKKDEESELRRSLRDRRDASRRIDEKAGELRVELAALESTESLPDPDEVNEARQRRDATWRDIKGRWEDGETAADNLERSHRFEAEIEQGDALSDRLLLGAKANERRSRLRAELAEAERAREREEKEAQRVESALETLRRSAAELWRELPVREGSIAEMLDFLEEARSLADDLRRHRDESAAQKVQAEVRAAEARTLDEELTQAGLPKIAEAKDPASLAAELERRAQEASEHADQRSRLLATREREHAELKALLRAEEDADAEQRRSLAAWRALRPALGLSAETDRPRLETSEIAEIERRRDRAHLRRRLRDFRRRLSAVAAAVAPDLESRLSTGPAAPIAAELQEREEKARADEVLRRERRRRLATIDDESSEVQAQLVEAQAALDTLEKDLDGESEAERRAAIKSLRQRVALGIRRDDILDSLRLLTEGAELASFAEAAKDCDPDQLHAQLEELKGQKKAEEAAKDRAIDEAARHESERDRMMRGRGAAEAALKAEIESDSARLLEATRRYRVLKTAEAILRREIDRFRAQSQGPVLERASELFRQLTLGSFVSVEADWNDQGDDIVRARRENEELLSMDKLSSGTRDQLFLALKLATVEHLVDSGDRGAMPLVLDDILVHFDDERSHAALEALASFSKKVQVLLFTHHRRVAEAAGNLTVVGVKVHEL
jgi:uncharacterized protein YhaN